MRNMSAQGRATMAKRRDFVNYARMTLADGTVLNLQPKDFRISGNTFTDDLVSGDSFEVGTAIGKTVNIRLDNTDERFSQYDFYMARFFLYLHLPEAYEDEHGVLQDEIFSLGLFTVTEPTTTGVVIDIAGIDEMYKFDTSFDACTLDFSTRPTLYTILARCCTDCDVAIGFSTFDNSTMAITNRPEGVTYREVVSFVCQMAGMNARINPTGALTLVWYDTSSLPSGLDGGTFSNPGTTSYQDGDTADGGTFDSGSTGYVYDGGSFDSPVGFHQLSQVKGLTVSTDDIHITGVKVTNEDTSVIAEQTFNAVKIKFGPNCKTESNVDFVRIYCKSGNTYRYTNNYTGGKNGATNNIANKEVIIPSEEFYVYWYTDSSVTDYGFDIVSIEPILVNSADLWNDFSGTSALPSYTPIELNGIGTKPETSHPYEDGERILWHWNTQVITNRPQYIIEVKDNPFTVEKESAIASFLYNKLSTLVFRPFSCSYLQDPTIEAGDAAIVWDIKGNSYKTIITNVKFDTNAMMTVASKAQSPARQKSSFKNVAAKAVIEAKTNTEKQIDAYAQTADHFTEIANNALGYYKTETTEQGATITYYHDAPTLQASTNIVKITGAGIFISDDGGQTYNSGYETSTATMLLNLVYAHGITADWVTSGLFQDKQGKFVLDIDNSTLKLDLTSTVGSGANATTLGAMLTKINATEAGLSTEVTRAQTAEGELNSIYSGAYAPTTSNSPASAWTTGTVKEKHLNDVFYNTSNGNTYQWKKAGGIEITFSSSSATESTSYDWVEIYYYDSSAGQYKKSIKYGGNGSSNNIANAKVIVPTSDFYVFWRTDGSVHDYYGFSISNIAVTNSSPSSFSDAGATLPVDVTTVLNGISTKPESTHSPYADNERTLWEWHTGLSLSYDWQLRQDIQTMSSSITQTAEQIALKVSKGDVSSQLSVESGQITLSSGRLIISTGNFRIDSSGTITCYGANINGSLHCGTDSSGRIDISGYQIIGNNNSRIDFNGYVGNDNGIHLNSGQVVFSVNQLGVTKTRNNSTVYTGREGKVITGLSTDSVKAVTHVYDSGYDYVEFEYVSGWSTNNTVQGLVVD